MKEGRVPSTGGVGWSSLWVSQNQPSKGDKGLKKESKGAGGKMGPTMRGAYWTCRQAETIYFGG